ncbi:MAG: hypothetical protein AAB067_07050, partial [Planctomycetota bacterium]
KPERVVFKKLSYAGSPAVVAQASSLPSSVLTAGWKPALQIIAQIYYDLNTVSDIILVMDFTENLLCN